MSNVIIGIIGVILFIGLAIAGATILGSDFITAGAASKAAIVTSHLQQIAQASQGLKARRGMTAASNSPSFGAELMEQNALKSVPVNPMDPSYAYIAANSAFAQDASDASYVYTSLGPITNKQARNVCYSIEETAGNANPAAVVDTAVNAKTRITTIGRLGCINAQGMSAYVAFAPA